MAYEKTPTSTFSGWSEDGTNVTFPIASVPGLDAVKADGSTGDIAEILYALLLQANLANTNKGQTKWSISKTELPLDGGDVRVIFALTFDLQVVTPAVLAVRDEP